MKEILAQSDRGFNQWGELISYSVTVDYLSGSEVDAVHAGHPNHEQRFAVIQRCLNELRCRGLITYDRDVNGQNGYVILSGKAREQLRKRGLMSTYPTGGAETSHRQWAKSAAKLLLAPA